MIIFLDFDGVLNNTRTWDSDDFVGTPPYVADRSCLEWLERLVMKLDATIVISSTWRILNDRQFFVDFLGDYLGSRIEQDWCTLRLGKLRGLEVQEWLQRNLGKNFWTFKDYIILDDDQDFIWHQPLVHINAKTGLDAKHVEKALMVAGKAKRVEIPEVLTKDLLEVLSEELISSKTKRRGTKATVAALHAKLVDFYH